MSNPSAAHARASTIPHAVIAADPWQIWGQAELSRLPLQSSPGVTASLQSDQGLKTPDGQATVTLRVGGTPTSGEIRLSLITAKTAPVADSHELRFLCRASRPGTLRIERQSAEPCEIELTRCWQDIVVVVPASTADRPLVTLVVTAQGEPLALHLGPVSATDRLDCQLPDTGWSLFLHAPPPAALDVMPSVLTGPTGQVPARQVALREGAMDCAALAGAFKERDSAMLWKEFDAPRAGILRIGVSADWWMQIWCNGAPIISTLKSGNGLARFVPQDHMVEMPVRAGRNLLAVQVLSGSRGWRFILGTLEIMRRPATPRGEVISGQFTDSAIYPGTSRNYWVYIPQQYDPARPACVHVSQDGHRQQFTDTLDELIDGQEMPVTIGVFISPGAMPAPSEAVAGRSNRCYEYDSLGDDYVRFLLEEMLPFVARKHGLNLSASGNDRSIGGCSSGGICAFNAAWERPDAFRRVYTNSGSFVAFRGGDIFPQMLRKYEAKPIRVFTHVATQDMENSGGNWWFANQEFERALVFANYEHQYRWSTGGHGDRYIEAFPEAMRWLWRDHPAPVMAKQGPPRIQDLLLPGELWSQVSDALEGASCLAVSPAGEIVVCDASANRIHLIGVDGRMRVLHGDAGQVSGLTCAADGRIHGVSSTTGHLLAFEPDGRKRVVASGVPGMAIAADRNGGFYVTGQQDGVGCVWRVDASGSVRLVDSGLRAATGVALSIDGWVLWVADGASHFVYAYRINPDGSLTNKERLLWLHVPDQADDSGAAAVACTLPANVILVATRLGIQTSDKEGHNQCIIPSPQGRMTGLVLGGADFSTLYAICDGRLFRRQVKVRGHHAFHPIAPITGHGL